MLVWTDTPSVRSAKQTCMVIPEENKCFGFVTSVEHSKEIILIHFCYLQSSHNQNTYYIL